MKLGICIPCHYGHIGYLDCVLASIDRQTSPPDVVSISISDMKETPTYKSDKYEIIVTTTPEQKNAAENRNIAATAILHKVDILSFIDADDYAAPRRIEIIRKIFEKEDVDLVLHSYLEWTQELQKKHVNDILPMLNSNTIEEIVLSNNFGSKVILIIPFGEIYIADNSFNFHNAHSSIKTSAFIKQQFPEDEIFHSYEDSHFNYLHYKRGTKILATPLKLSLYSIDSTKDPLVVQLVNMYGNDLNLIKDIHLAHD
jgi:hypothetical protein